MVTPLGDLLTLPKDSVSKDPELFHNCLAKVFIEGERYSISGPYNQGKGESTNAPPWRPSQQF